MSKGVEIKLKWGAIHGEKPGMPIRREPETSSLPDDPMGTMRGVRTVKAAVEKAKILGVTPAVYIVSKLESGSSAEISMIENYAKKGVTVNMK